jgi:hypothetical protein
VLGSKPSGRMVLSSVHSLLVQGTTVVTGFSSSDDFNQVKTQLVILGVRNADYVVADVIDRGC